METKISLRNWTLVIKFQSNRKGSIYTPAEVDRHHSLNSISRHTESGL